MTKEQVNTIWTLAMEIQFKAHEFGKAKGMTQEFIDKGEALMRAKSNLYGYLKENLDDTERL